MSINEKWDSSDVGVVALAHYGWSSNEDEDVFFDVVSPVGQLTDRLNAAIPLVEYGRIRALIMIVDLDGSAWTALVVVRRSNRLVAFYADSLVARPVLVGLGATTNVGNIAGFAALRHSVAHAPTIHPVVLVDVSKNLRSSENHSGDLALEAASAIERVLLRDVTVVEARDAIRGRPPPVHELVLRMAHATTLEQAGLQ